MYSIPAARSFSTAMKNPQPAPQYGQTVGTSTFVIFIPNDF
jgi:hypothetical protein